MPRKKIPDNSGNNAGLKDVGSPATKFFNQYFSNLLPLPIVHSPYDGYVGFKFREGNAFFKETPTISYHVSEINEEGLGTVKCSVFEAKMADGSPMLLFKFDWLSSAFFIWLPYTDYDCRRLCKAAKIVNTMVTHKLMQGETVHEIPVKLILHMVKREVPHAEIKTAGRLPVEWESFEGDLNNVHKDIDRFLRPGLSLIGEVPPLKSKEQLAQEEKEWKAACQGLTKEEILAKVNKNIEEQSRRGGDIVYRNLLGATQAELLAMPLDERIAFMENHIKQEEEKKAKVKEEVKRIRQEMLGEQETTPVKPVAVKKTQKSKSKVKSKET